MLKINKNTAYKLMFIMAKLWLTPIILAVLMAIYAYNTLNFYIAWGAIAMFALFIPSVACRWLVTNNIQ